MLFEEAALYLLRRSGFRTIDNGLGDPTLRPHRAGLGVVGRGALHQIDAVADYIMPRPFSHPSRLLVEAKCYRSRNVGLEVLRNAVGVLKDVSEFWSTVDGLPENHRRYHYQKAIFSATSFSEEAERYAFAHDIYLFPVGTSHYLQPLLKSIFAITGEAFPDGGRKNVPILLSALRERTRQHLRNGTPNPPVEGASEDLHTRWRDLVDQVKSLDGVLVGVLSRTFPLFLVPESPEVLRRLERSVRVQVGIRRGRWYLRTPDGDRLFSFDLPPTLFSLYAEAGMIASERAVALKQRWFPELTALLIEEGRPRWIQFELHPDWLTTLRQSTAEAD